MEDHRYSLDSKGNQSFFDTIGLKCSPLRLKIQSVDEIDGLCGNLGLNYRF